MNLTLLYITARQSPETSWLYEGLVAQGQAGDDIEVIVVNLHDTRPAGLVDRATLPRFTPVHGGLVTVQECQPKPTIWQGPHRVTTKDWWAKSSAINTGFALAAHDFIACVDDRCRLGPDWLKTVRKAERKRDVVVCGSYNRLEEGRVTPDARRTLSPTGKRDCRGTWLYGCTWALPLAWALEVNGFEEGTDGLGAEDYIFGLNLEHAGRRLDFIPAMLVGLERSPQYSTGSNGHAISPVPGPVRADKGTSPNDKSHAALHRFGPRKRTEFTPDLTEMRASLRRGEPFPVPDPAGDYRDWYDGQSIREL